MKLSTRQKITSLVLSASLVAGTLSFTLAPASADTSTASDSVLKLRIMETTDLHTNMVNYDYYQDKLTDEYGLAKTATLIKQSRAEVKNSMLFDNGDLLQGNPLGDYVAKVKPLKDGETHPVYKAMNELQYDAANIGNHEFNFGLEHLDRSLKGAKFPYVNSNVYIDDKDKDPNNDKNRFEPYVILDRTFKDEAGKDVKLKVGVIGFVPPQIMSWDEAHLSGKVIAKDMVESAKKFVPEMKKKGADLIVAIPHSGISTESNDSENANLELSKIDGIDAILFGHSHAVFPGKGFENIKGVDAKKGLINGIPAVMPGFWGDNLGVIDLELKQVNGEWDVVNSISKAVPVYDKENKKALVEADKTIVDAVKEDHDHTVKWVRSAVGKTTAPIHSYFALVQDDPSVQIVTNAQKWYTEKAIKGTELEGLPVLSAGAPFKAGGRQGVNYYTNIPKGTLAIKNVADLYVYPNTLKVVKINGAQVQEWLERSAGQFNQIDPKKKGEQALINEEFRTYNFDILDGVTYQIDVTQPSKYDTDGKLINKKAKRIKNLSYKGKPVKATDKFLVVTNNYRATGGGSFPSLDGSNIVIDSQEETRQVVINYILEKKTINPTVDKNWSFVPLKNKANVTFVTSPNAKEFAKKQPHMKYQSTLDTGFAKFSIDLSKKKK